jgi:hypothetical protein
MRKTMWGIGVLFAVNAGAAESPEPACLQDPGPRAAVVSYITAMKANRFEDAYPFVTATMTDGKSAAEWAAPQRKLFELGGVKIGEIDVRAAKREMLDATTCAPRAKVPNVLHAGDVLNNQGSTEFELYNVVLEGDQWKIDSQESLYDEPAIREWFPNDKIPEFEETADPK